MSLILKANEYEKLTDPRTDADSESISITIRVYSFVITQQHMCLLSYANLMLLIIGALLIVMDLTQVLEQMSQISNFALISIVPAHNNFLS